MWSSEQTAGMAVGFLACVPVECASEALLDSSRQLHFILQINFKKILVGAGTVGS